MVSTSDFGLRDPGFEFGKRHVSDDCTAFHHTEPFTFSLFLDMT